MGIPREEKPLRASKGQFSSERLSEAFPPLVLHLRSSSNVGARLLEMRPGEDQARPGEDRARPGEDRARPSERKVCRSFKGQHD